MWSISKRKDKAPASGMVQALLTTSYTSGGLYVPVRPGLRLIGKKGFGGGPYLPEQLRAAVAVQVLFGVPEAVGAVYVGLVQVLQELHVLAAFKGTDPVFRVAEDLQELLRFLRLKRHPDNANQHNFGMSE